MPKFHSRHWLLVAIDTASYLLIAAVYYLISACVSYSIPTNNLGNYALNVFVMLVFLLIARFIFGTYRTVWRYPHTLAYLALIVAEVGGGVAALFTMYVLRCFAGGWFYVTVCALDALLILSERFAYRMLYRLKDHVANDDEQNAVMVGIIGAGEYGAHVAQEIESGKHPYRIVGFFDRDKTKVGSYVSGYPVYYYEDFASVQAQTGITEVIVAISRLKNDELLSFREYYEKHGCKVRIYAPFGDTEDNRPVLRDIRIEDILFRQPIDVASDETFDFYRHRVVLVTGGGGSIGSELARQIASLSPKKLILFDIYENNVYDIQQELNRRYGNKLDLCVEIGSVRDRDRLETVFRTYRPEIVLHAAAHKHVPLMEHSGTEAIKNNVVGTYNTADMAEKYGTKKFLLISTDKAVNPTNLMGASKRLCEMVIESRTDSKTSFCAVRFGNVLGSNGSVIPLFKKQIAVGGPVTITDKRIIRYFMTIPEAAQLVMKAGAMARNGELFVLDMGKPVRIYDLAENMIRLSGFKPNVDIRIEEIGLRPGEKLFEELLIDTEKLTKTKDKLIFIEHDTPLSRVEVDEKIAALNEAIRRVEAGEDYSILRAAYHVAVPTFREPDEINRDAESAAEMQAVRE